MRHRLMGLVFAVLAGLAGEPAHAEIAWLGDVRAYQLTGADLFRLQAEMPEALQQALKPLRNVTYPNETKFRDAVAALLTDPAEAGDWLDRLTGIAAAPGVAFGAEPLKTGILTLHVADSADRFDPTSFAARSWLGALPPAAERQPQGIAAQMDGACLRVTTEDGEKLFALCDAETGPDGTSATLEADAEAIYGLGQQFTRPGETIANRIGETRNGRNAMEGFNGAANGNTLIPIAYFDRPGVKFALILDNRYPQVWDFAEKPWRLSVKGGDLHLHVLTGDTLAELRRKYMALSGTPPVPPKAMFGFWLSEYGFDNWDELDERLATLAINDIPVSGVVLDLQWFGGIGMTGGASHMGSLTFDRAAFPDPEGKIAELADKGISTMLIEEPYIDKGLPEFADMGQRGYLAHDADGQPLLTSPTRQWWGHGGIIDWANADAGAYWHDLKRQPLVDMGIAGHWTDLGEPEAFNPGNLYGTGLTHAEIQNSYNLLWLESIADGYRRNVPSQRVFMMSRSGAAGMQRLGAAMWSADTASDFWSLRAQMPQQTHMMWSGLDYYGSDVGGFVRTVLSHFDGAPDRDTAMNELYTQWLAYAALFELPVRAHTENVCNCYETAPDRIGDLASNRANLKLRAALLPYYYSLAHEAWQKGEPVFPSLDYWYPYDPATRALSTTKMIGRQLVGAAVSEYGASSGEIYLPAGTWYDFRNGRRVDSSGDSISEPLWRDGVFTLPLFARDGAIVPMQRGGKNMLHVFGAGDGFFDWFDDDGKTLAYQDGIYDLIQIDKSGFKLTLTRALGDALVPAVLNWHLPDGALPHEVLIDGEPVGYGIVGSAVRLSLPDFARRLTVEIRL